jgi:hypothetical protein
MKTVVSAEGMGNQPNRRLEYLFLAFLGSQGVRCGSG